MQLRTKTLQSNCKLKRWHIRSKTSIKIDLYWVLKNQIESVESTQRRQRRSKMTCTIFFASWDESLCNIKVSSSHSCIFVLFGCGVLWAHRTLYWRHALNGLHYFFACRVETLQYQCYISALLHFGARYIQTQRLQDTLRLWFVKAPQNDLHFFASWAALHNHVGAS